VSQIDFLSNTQWAISFRLSLEGEGGRGISGEYRNTKQTDQNFQKDSRNRFLLGVYISDLPDGDPSRVGKRLGPGREKEGEMP
jgi:hypothetical protein